jgi:hypothetical protein
MAETMMVAATAERFDVGTEFDTLPQKVTYGSWFELPDDLREAFFAMLEDVVIESSAPQPIGGSELIYGNEVRGYEKVRRLDRATPGYNVIKDFYAHAAIYSFIRSVDSNFDGTYFGTKWKSHTSPNLAEGELFPVNSLTAFRKNHVTRKKIVEKALPWEVRS